MNKSFVFGWTSEASVSTKEWGWEFKKSSLEMETD